MRDYARRVLEINLNKFDWILYLTVKKAFQGQTNDYTDPAVVPYIHGLVAKHYGYKLIVRTRIWNKAALLNIVYPHPYSEFQKMIIRKSEWGTHVLKNEETNLGAAVYCSMLYAHAQFDTQPVAGTTLAIRWERKK